MTRSNSGFSASQSGSSWAITANGWLKKLERRGRRRTGRCRRSSGRPARAAIRMWRASSARASSRSWTSIAKPATAPVASGTLTIRSIRRSPRMIAGCIRETIRPLSLRLARRRRPRCRRPARRSARRRARSRPAASLPSTASTKALLTRPSLRSGPRYHIGNGAASIRWVSELSARLGLARAAARAWRALPRPRSCRRTTAAGCPAVPAPAPARREPRTRATSRATRTFAASFDADARAASISRRQRGKVVGVRCRCRCREGRPASWARPSGPSSRDKSGIDLDARRRRER